MSGNGFAKLIWTAVFFSTIWNIWLVRNTILFDNADLDCGKLVEDSLVNASFWVKSFIGSSDFSTNEFLYNVSAVRMMKISKAR